MNKNIFVIHKHQARNLHYDFRIEVGGVLKSWVVKKGLPEDYSEKRLAIETEDHDIKYADFKGTIPQGQHGAGTVEIWDKGTFENISEENGKKIPIKKALSNGHVDILLHGKNVQGKFVLLFYRETRGQKHWILRKAKS